MTNCNMDKGMVCVMKPLLYLLDVEFLARSRAYGPVMSVCPSVRQEAR